MRTPCSRVELHHVPTGTVAGFEHTPDTLREHLSRAEQIGDQARAATEAAESGGDPDSLFPARPAPRCGTCDFRPSCLVGQAAAPPVRSWDLLAPLDDAAEQRA